MAEYILQKAYYYRHLTPVMYEIRVLPKGVHQILDTSHVAFILVIHCIQLAVKEVNGILIYDRFPGLQTAAMLITMYLQIWSSNHHAY